MTAIAKYAKVFGMLLILMALYFAWGAWNDIQHRLAQRDTLLVEKKALLNDQQRLKGELVQSRDLLKAYAKRTDLNTDITAKQAVDLDRLQSEISAIRKRNESRVVEIRQVAQRENKGNDDPRVVIAVSSQRLQSLWETYCVTTPQADMCKQQ